MPSLGDFLPQLDKEEYIGRHLKPGQVLYLFSQFTRPPKEKYLVLACPGSTSLLFVINSRIHPFIAKRPELNQAQIKLSVSNYPFLEHDSFINCSEVIDAFDETDIKNQLLSDLGRIKGELNVDTKQAIIQVVQKAKTISKQHKTLIINALK